MKKYIFLLLLCATGMAQTYQNPTFGTITTKTAPTSVTPPTMATVESSGVVGKIIPENIPMNVIPPTTHYTPTTPTLKGHFQGIDNAIGNIPLTTAGNTTRVWFTGDATTITAGTFYLTNPTNKGTVANVSQSVINDDNQKKYFTQDLIGQPFATATLFPPGVYAGNLSASTTPNSAQQRFTVELYKCNNAGTPIASGVSGAPVGDLGVTVILILDSGLLTLADGSVTNVPVSASLASQFSIGVGERIRYHVSAEKVGTASSNITESVWYGNSFNSFIDVPTPITSSGVSNLSTVTGATVTNALDNLSTGKENSANKQNSLATDGTGVKFPTIDAINDIDNNLVHKTGSESIYDDKEFMNASVFNDGVYVKTRAYTVTSTSSNLAANLNQGYAWDGTNHYLIGTSRIAKMDSSFNVIVDNTTPFTGTTGANHLGDGVYLGGFLYVPAQTSPGTTGMQIIKYNATTLAFVATYDISATNPNCSALTTDGTYLYVASFEDGSKLWKYDLVGNFIGLITISSPITGIQGISYYLGDLYITNETNLYKVSLSGINKTNLGTVPGDISSIHRTQGLEVVSGVARVLIVNEAGFTNVFYLSSSATYKNYASIDSGGNIKTNGNLEITTDNVATPFSLSAYSTNAGQGASFFAKKYGGTKASPAAVSSNTPILALFAQGYTGSSLSGAVGGIRIMARENFTPTANGTHIVFETTAIGATSRTEKMRIDNDGGILINTTSNPSSFKLNVNGTTGLASTLTLLATPTTSAGTYDILTRNTSTGAVEKVASSTIALDNNVVHKTGFETILGTKRFEAVETTIGVSFLEQAENTYLSATGYTSIAFDANSMNIMTGAGKNFNINHASVTSGKTFSLPNATGTFALTSDLSAYATTASPAFTGTPTAPTAAPGTNTNQVATMAALQAATSAVRPYLVYTALISQSGTSAPTEIVLENTLGATATWSRSAAGTYQASFSSAVLTANKTAVFVTKQITGFTDVVVSANSNNTASIDVVVSNGTLRDSELNKASLEIRVYN